MEHVLGQYEQCKKCGLKQIMWGKFPECRECEHFKRGSFTLVDWGTNVGAHIQADLELRYDNGDETENFASFNAGSLEHEKAKGFIDWIKRPDTSAELEGLLETLVYFCKNESQSGCEKQVLGKIRDLFKRHEGRG